MEPLERLGKAVRGIIAVFHGHVDHLRIRPGKLLGRQRHPASPDVFAHGHAAQGAKDALVIEGGQRRLASDLFYIQIFCQVLFHVIDRCLKPFYPASHFHPAFRLLHGQYIRLIR